MVYNDVMKKKSFSALLSTRYFGHMLFDSAWTNRMDNLICYFLGEKEDGLVYGLRPVTLKMGSC